MRAASVVRRQKVPRLRALRTGIQPPKKNNRASRGRVKVGMTHIIAKCNKTRINRDVKELHQRRSPLKAGRSCNPESRAEVGKQARQPSFGKQISSSVRHHSFQRCQEKQTGSEKKCMFGTERPATTTIATTSTVDQSPCVYSTAERA